MTPYSFKNENSMRFARKHGYERCFSSTYLILSILVYHIHKTLINASHIIYENNIGLYGKIKRLSMDKLVTHLLLPTYNELWTRE